MSTNNREARRRRILQGSQDRLNLITGHVHNIPSNTFQSIVPDVSFAYDEDSDKTPAQSLPLISHNLDSKSDLSDYPPVSRYEADKPTDYVISRHDQAIESNENDGFGGGSREEPNMRRHGTGSDPPTAYASEVRGTPEPSSAAQWTPPVASRPEQYIGTLFGSVTSQQLSSAISTTEQTRRIFSVTMSLLVLLSYFGFPIVGNKIISSIILFRPLSLLLFVNISLIILRLLAELEQGGKDAHKLPGWAEEASRALEVGLMLQSVLGSLFMDFSMYAFIIICGFCLAG